jgi:hypothetical protein
VVGVVDGSVAADGVADGSGLAAETMAAPPPTRMRPEMAAVRMVRRRPLGLVFVVEASASGGGCAGSSGWLVQSIGISFDPRPPGGSLDPDRRGHA